LALPFSQFHPFIEDFLSKAIPVIEGDGLQSQNLYGTCSETVASLRCHQYIAATHDSKFERHTHGASISMFICFDDCFPPSVLHDSEIGLLRVIGPSRELSTVTVSI
jgi:hypothetical protein